MNLLTYVSDHNNNLSFMNLRVVCVRALIVAVLNVGTRVID